MDTMEDILKELNRALPKEDQRSFIRFMGRLVRMSTERLEEGPDKEQKMLFCDADRLDDLLRERVMRRVGENVRNDQILDENLIQALRTSIRNLTILIETNLPEEEEN